VNDFVDWRFGASLLKNGRFHLFLWNWERPTWSRRDYERILRVAWWAVEKCVDVGSEI
jgi:hypothetical protein